MSVSQKEIVEECFEGTRIKDCTYCPAHHSKAGLCCFGHRFEYNDGQCDHCNHNGTCEPLTYEFEAAKASRLQRPVRVPVKLQTQAARRKLPIYGQIAGQANGNLIADRAPTPITVNKNEVDTEMVSYFPSNPADSKWKRFFKGMGLVGVWGAGEGSLEMVLGYLRRRRPE